MNYNLVLEKVRDHVQAYFSSHADPDFAYHNRVHTEGVVAAAIQIANHYQLEDKDFFIVITAAWFHDLGYFIAPANHEVEGGALAEELLKENGIDDAAILAVKQCILATQLPQHPVNLLEQIVCDADMFHLGTDAFPERNKLMRKEAEALAHKDISKEYWRTGTIALFKAHHYFTEYCQQLLNNKKQENLDKLLQKDADFTEKHKDDPVQVLIGQHEAAEETENNAVVPEKENKKEKKAKKEKSGRPERGIDNVFKIASTNNQRLSSQADSKAHIMIQVNSIIVSVVLSLLLKNIESHMDLVIPAFMLLATNLLAIIFSVLATRPSIPHGTFSQADLDEKKVNLMFFGNFYKMSLEQYAAGMLKMMDDSEFLYGSLIRDVYFQGIALGRKYRHLRISYNIFMFGLIASVLAFIIAALHFQ